MTVLGGHEVEGEEMTRLGGRRGWNVLWGEESKHGRDQNRLNNDDDGEQRKDESEGRG